jgi:hypothetical protein
MSDDPNSLDLSLDQFLEGLPENEIHTDYIRLQSSMAGVRDIPVDPNHVTENGLPGYALGEVLRMGNMTWNNQTQFFLGEAQIDLNAVIPNRATVTAIGLLKGGA